MKWTIALVLLLLACGTEPCDEPPAVYRWPATELTQYGVPNDGAVVTIFHECNRYVCRTFHADSVADSTLVDLCTSQWALEGWP